MKKRRLNENEEQVYRLCHQDFEGLSTAEASVRMQLTQRHVQRLLNSAKAKCSQLFPILTKTQATFYHLYTVEGWSEQEIADRHGVTQPTVAGHIVAAVKRGMPKPARSGRVVRFEDDMDGQIKERF